MTKVAPPWNRSSLSPYAKITAMPPRVPAAAICRQVQNASRATSRQTILLRTISTTKTTRSATTSSNTSQRSQSTSQPPPSASSTASLPPNGEQPFTTVSPDEVSHFNALASSWWDPHGPSRILHLMNPLRHDFIRSIRASVGDVYNPGEKLKFLDIGCGGGIFAESAARLPTTSSVTAIDPTPQVLAIAKTHAKRDPVLNPTLNPGRLTYLNTSIENLPVPKPEEAYDIVSVFEVLEHVASPAEFLDRCTPFVKPGGWLVMSTIARTWMSWFTTNFMAEDVLRIVPRGTHDWAKYINEEELRRHFESVHERGDGGGVGDVKGVWEAPRVMGVIYIPGVGWKEVKGSEKVGNYFFAVRKRAD